MYEEQGPSCLYLVAEYAQMVVQDRCPPFYDETAFSFETPWMFGEGYNSRADHAKRDVSSAARNTKSSLL